MTDLRRRTVLAGAFGAAVAGAGYLVAEEVLPGRTAVLRATGFDDYGPCRIPDVDPGPLRRGSLAARNRPGVTTRWVLALPPGRDDPRGLPVAVFLHGRGGDAEMLLRLGLDRFLAAAVLRAGVAPFALAAIDGGDTYWHPRRAGGDSGAMVLEEFLPLLAGLGLAAGPRDRVALAGYSMGGYGSLLLASELGPERVASVAAMSPALWTSFGDSAPGAFDDAADFERHDVFERGAVLSRIPVHVDCGWADPFHGAAREFTERVPVRQTDFGRGDHSWGYWRAQAPSVLSFTGKALRR